MDIIFFTLTIIDTSCKNASSILTKSFFSLANNGIWRLVELRKNNVSLKS